MADFYLHELGRGRGESTSDDLPGFPTYSQTTFDHELVVSQLENSSAGTLTVGLHEAPADDDDLYSSVHTFSSVAAGDSFPTSEKTTLGFREDTRFMRIEMEIEGSGDWHFQFKSSTTFFDPSSADTELIDPSNAEASDFTNTAKKAEGDVVSRVRTRARGALNLQRDEGVDEALKRAIAERIDWIYERRTLANERESTEAGRRLERHEAQEWDNEEEQLRGYVITPDPNVYL